MAILRFLKYFFIYAGGHITWTQMMYLVREGIDPRTPANIRFAVELKSVDKPVETERERLLPLKNHTILLRDLTTLHPDKLIYHSTDSEKAESALQRLKYDLARMPCHEFYDKWVINPNFDFLITADDRIGRLG